jgi:uncharacterized protein
MNHSIRNLIVCLMALLSGWHTTLSFAQLSQPVTIPNSELRSLQSELLGQELNLFIKLPATYFNDEKRIYPVLYFTDGNRNFGMISNILAILETPGSGFNDAVAIGIGYNSNDLADFMAWRTRDLTPVNSPGTDRNISEMLTRASGRTIEVKSGGAAKFLDCIMKEVIPFAESNYRISRTERALGGYSYGGLFTLFTLFTHPEAFNRYFAGSPSPTFGNSAIFRIEEASELNRPGLNLQLFMTAGALEGESMTGNVRKMAEQLQARNYPGLKTDFYIFENESHLSCYPAAVMRFLRILCAPETAR